MALVTRCPNCFTIFRITPLHLQAHSGEVRCGQCAHIFNGFATLLTMEEPEAKKPVKTGEAAKTPQSAPQFSVEVPPSPQAGFSPTQPDLPVEQSEMPASPDVEISHREAIQEGRMGESAASEPGVSAPVKPESARPRVPETPAKEKPASRAAKIAGRARDRQVAREPIPQTDDAMYAGLEDAMLDNYLPEHYVSRKEQLPEITLAWAVANFFLLVVLMAQVVYAFRSELAVSMPAARPFLEQYCKVLQCTVSLPPPTGSENIGSSGTTASLSVHFAVAADKRPSISAHCHNFHSLSSTARTA